MLIVDLRMKQIFSVKQHVGLQLPYFPQTLLQVLFLTPQSVVCMVSQLCMKKVLTQLLQDPLVTKIRSSNNGHRHSPSQDSSLCQWLSAAHDLPLLTEHLQVQHQSEIQPYRNCLISLTSMQANSWQHIEYYKGVYPFWFCFSIEL